jgi:hypothetical protein
MKNTLLIITILSGLFLASPCSAQLSFIGSAEIYVSESYAVKLKGEKFIEGNKIKDGNLKGVEGGFLIFSIPSTTPGDKKSQVVIIPVTEVVYIKGIEKMLNH